MKVSSKEGDFFQENVKFEQLIILGFWLVKYQMSNRMKKVPNSNLLPVNCEVTTYTLNYIIFSSLGFCQSAAA